MKRLKGKAPLFILIILLVFMSVSVMSTGFLGCIPLIKAKLGCYNEGETFSLSELKRTIDAKRKELEQRRNDLMRHPIRVVLDEPGEPVTLKFDINMHIGGAGGGKDDRWKASGAGDDPSDE